MSIAVTDKPILVPRPAGRGGELIERLQQMGYSVDHSPFVELKLEHDADMREAVRQLADGGFNRLVLTSRTAVEALAWFEDADEHGACFAVPDGVEVWVVGDGTAQELREHGIEPDLVADGSAAALVEQAPPAPEGGGTILFPASAAAAPTVERGLTQKGWDIERVTAYRPRSAAIDPQMVLDLRLGTYAAVVLTSSMLATLVGSLAINVATRIVTIGEPTSEAARARNLVVHAQAEQPTDRALARAVHLALTENLS